MTKETIVGHAHASRCEGPTQEFRFEFRETGGDRRRIFTVIMTAEQFAEAITSRVSAARMEYCDFPKLTKKVTQ